MVNASNIGINMRRLVPLLAAAAAFMAVAASSSQAGTYPVTACNAAPGNVNHAWVASSTTAHLATSQTCPSSGVASGLLTQDVLVTSDTLPGDGAQWTFAAPTGTAITAISYDRYAYLDGDDGWSPGLRLADGTSFDRCTIPGGSTGCGVGSGPAGTGGAISRTGLSTTALTFGLYCDPITGGGQCLSGFTIHSATAALYGSTVTVSDSVAPALSGAGGNLTSASGYRSGSQSGTLTATDSTGIKQTSVYVDGTQYDATARTCDYTYAAPCSSLTAGTLSLNTAQVADGSHSVQLAATDAGGNEVKTSAVSMTFDNTAPAAPTGLAVAGGASKATNSFDVSWTNPGGAQVAPLTNVRYQVGSGAVQTLGLVTQASAITLPGSGSYTLRVWLVDAAGNEAPSSGATTTLTYTPASSGGGGGGGGGGGSTTTTRTTTTPAAPVSTGSAPTAPTTPVVPTTPTVPATPAAAAPALHLAALTRTGATIAARGTIAKAATGKVTITYSARVDAKLQRQSTTAKLSRGAYRVSLRLTGKLAKTKRGTLTVTYAGSAKVKAGRTHATVRITR
jgi:hypothetical protein